MSTSKMQQIDAKEFGETKMMWSWIDLPLDLVDLIASRLGFVDYMRFCSLRKYWYSNLALARIPKPENRPWPVLVYLPNEFKGVCKFFDPIIGRVDVSELDIRVDGRLTLRSAKDAWMIMSDECEDEDEEEGEVEDEDENEDEDEEEGEGEDDDEDEGEGEGEDKVEDEDEDEGEGEDEDEYEYEGKDKTKVFMTDIFFPRVFIANLPLIKPTYLFHGICFSSPPTDSNCVVMTIRGSLDDSVITICTWRHGQESWSKEKKYKNNTPFLFLKTGNSNPVFHKGLFYCLGKNGNLGTFDPNVEEWTVLDKPKPTHQMPKCLTGEDLAWNVVDRIEECCYLVKSFRGHLLSIFDYNNGKPLLVMRLDESKMAWRKVEELDDEVVFLDARNSISIQAPSKTLENRIYFTRFLSEDDKPIEGVYYCLKSKKYHSNPKYEVREKVHRTWVMSRTYTSSLEF